MITKPILEYRTEQPYAAVPLQAPIPFGKYLAPAWEAARLWLERQGVAPRGAPFIRYLTTDMSTKLDLEVGFPVDQLLPGDDHISTGILPAGKYATLVYTGSVRGKGLVKATITLLDWANANAIRWDTSPAGKTERWNGRLEWYLTDPQAEPDPQKWQTELAFLVAEP